MAPSTCSDTHRAVEWHAATSSPGYPLGPSDRLGSRGVPGTPPERLAAGDWAEHHSPLFRIAPEPSIKAGVEAMTLAALDLLAPADATAGAGLNRAGTTP